jgi:hypothetical protein
MLTPHFNDGYWTEQTAASLGWNNYPFSRYVWDWEGRTQSDQTLIIEGPPRNLPEHPPQKFQPNSPNEFDPGQKHNV